MKFAAQDYNEQTARRAGRPQRDSIKATQKPRGNRKGGKIVNDSDFPSL